jgi:hemoglobin/transferrin/lactoferrin receptor protein
MAAYTLGLKSNTGMYNSSNVILSFQDIAESRHSRGWNSSTLKSQWEKVKVYSLNWDLNKSINNVHDLSYGVEASYNDVTSTADRYNVNNGAITPADTRYPSAGSNMTFLAAYVTDNWKFSPNVYMNVGARLNYVKLKTDFSQDTAFFKFPFTTVEQSNFSPTGNLGFTFRPVSDFKIYVNGSTGFRAPNIDDVAKVFESVRGTATTLGRVIVPNPNLKPEYTINGELGISKIFNNMVKVDIVGYYTLLNDAIISAPFTYNGSSQIIYDGFLANVYAYQNVAKANVYGGSFSLNADFSEHVSYMGTINYTKGKVTEPSETPLDHIPPVIGKTGFIFTFDRFKADLNTVFNMKKDLADYSPSGEDNAIDATWEGMPAWWTLNLRTGYQLTKSLNVQFDLENALDQNYRVFASGISAPGRNFVFSLRGNF